MRRTIAVALAALAAAATPALAGPTPRDPPADTTAATVEPTTAEDWLRLGLSRYDSGDFTGAVEAFQAGHAIDPRPSFLFAIAQAERRRGDCAAAIRYYQQFLATSPARDQESAAIEQRDRCEEALAAAEPAPRPEPETEAVPDPVVPASTPVAASPLPLPAATTARPAWYRDPITLGLGGSAALATVAGVALLLSADRTASAAAAATSYDEHATLRDRAESHQLFGTISASAGLVLAGATVFRIIQIRRRAAPERRHAVQLGVGPGVGLAIGGSF